MPTTGQPFRVYFFWFGSVAWFDQDVTGGRYFGSATLDQLWPDIASLMVGDNDEQPPIQSAYPVSPTVLRVARRSNHIGGEMAMFVDVPRGVAVPTPLVEQPSVLPGGSRQMVSWDPGPVLMTMDPSGNSTQLIDVRTGLRGPETPFTLGNPDWPILAIPGEPVRRFFNTNNGTLVLAQDANGNQVSQQLLEAFPHINVSAVDAVTVMYGDFRRPSVSDLTAELDDTELTVLASAAQIVHDDGPGLLAVLSILTGASPGAYHPDGHFGIAHMTADQLASGGWGDLPERIITAGAERQFEILGQYLAALDPTTTDTLGKVLAVLATGQPSAGGDDTVVVPDPVPTGLQNLVPIGDDGAPATQITLGDLQRMIDALLEGPAGREIFGRMRTHSFA